MVEQNVADVNGGDLLHLQGAQRAHSHDGRVPKLTQSASGQAQDAAEVGRCEGWSLFARHAAKALERLDEALHAPARERKRLAVRAMTIDCRVNVHGDRT
eukprot:123881-Rhodomonas_salina.1